MRSCIRKCACLYAPARACLYAHECIRTPTSMSFCACARPYGCIELATQDVGEEDLAPPAADAQADNTVARAQKGGGRI